MRSLKSLNTNSATCNSLHSELLLHLRWNGKIQTSCLLERQLDELEQRGVELEQKLRDCSNGEAYMKKKCIIMIFIYVALFIYVQRGKSVCICVCKSELS